MNDASLAEICVVACAEAWRGDGEIVASPIGTIPTIAVRLAGLTIEPDLLYTDGDAVLLAEPIPVGAGSDHPRVSEGWLPFGHFFDVVWSGKRHVMMGATQIDRYGNQNISCIGEFAQPKAMLLGCRGGPGNTINHPTSYWVPNHSPRVFVERVDHVSGIGYDRADGLPFHEIRRVVSNKAVMDFETDDHRMRLRSVHPGVTVDDVVASTGFDLAVPDDVAETRLPTDDELRLIREELDPNGLRDSEVKA